MNSKLLNKVSQRYFGELCSYAYTEGGSDNISAVFNTAWVEVLGISSYALTCEVVLSDLKRAPKKGDLVTHDSKTYKVDVSQPSSDGSLYLLILKD